LPLINSILLTTTQYTNQNQEEDDESKYSSSDFNIDRPSSSRSSMRNNKRKKEDEETHVINCLIHDALYQFKILGFLMRCWMRDEMLDDEMRLDGNFEVDLLFHFISVFSFLAINSSHQISLPSLPSNMVKLKEDLPYGKMRDERRGRCG